MTGRSTRTWVASLAVGAAASLMACTVTRAGECVPSSAGAGAGAAAAGSGLGSTAPAEGVTDDSITLSMLSVDLNALSEQGLAPDIGNPAEVAEAVVADINASGGVAGRDLVLKPHVLDAASALLNPEGAQGDCIAATEQDKPVSVIVTAALPSALVRCVSVTHPVLAMTMNQWDDTLYEESEGRLFSCCSNISAGLNRVYAAWPKLMVDAGAIEPGTKVGIISQQPGGIATDQRDAIENALEPATERAGAEVVATAELPCPETSQSCAQHPAAIQKMKDSGVEAVFLTATNLAASATVEAAENLDFHPVWMTSGDNTTNTVANFFAPVRDEWDGAYGISLAFPEPTKAADDCNRIAAAAGVRFEPGSDGYGFTAVTCLQVQLLAKALDTIEGQITQAKLIAALEAIGEVPSANGPDGSFSGDKHDAGNHVYVTRYSAADGKFHPVGGTATPVRVP